MMTNETERLEQILSALDEITAAENLQMKREAEPLIYTPYKGLLIPDLHTIKKFFIEPQNPNNDFPQIEVEYNASIRLSTGALDKWKDTPDLEGMTMEDIIRELSPIIELPHILITLEMWLSRRHKYFTEERRRYFVGSNGLVLHSPRIDSDGYNKYANYKNFTNKPYETMFRHLLGEFKQLAGS